MVLFTFFWNKEKKNVKVSLYFIFKNLKKYDMNVGAIIINEKYFL